MDIFMCLSLLGTCSMMLIHHEFDISHLNQPSDVLIPPSLAPGRKTCELHFSPETKGSAGVCLFSI
jgi:hypothetical protein